MISATSNVLLRSPNWLGDAVMTLPSVQQLASGSRQFTMLCPEKLTDFWRLIPQIRETIPVQSKICATARLLRPKKFDIAIIFPNSLKTGLEPFLARIPQRYGFHGHQRRWLLTGSWSHPSHAKGYVHHANHYLYLLQQLLKSDADASHDSLPLDLAHGKPRFTPVPKPAPSALATKPYLALCPGAEYGPAKRWLTERYAQTVNRIRAKHDLDVVILGTKGDREIAARLKIQCSKPVHDLTGKTTLAEFLALIANSRLALCNDSGAMHVAAMFGTPAVAIFGSTEPRLTAPLGDSVTVIREHVPCSPFILRECPLDNRCMLAISVDQVTAACLKKL